MNANMWASQHGAQILTDVATFAGRFIAYPSEHAAVAHALWIAHTHAMTAWENTPRIGFLSPEPGSGKSRALEVSELLVPQPVHAVNVSPAYLFRKVSDEQGPPTILFDEIDTVFGPKAKDNEDIRGMLNAGHRRGATAGRCVIRGKIVETEELPAYCAVAIAGLNDLPDTISSRTIIVRMRRRAPHERVEPFRHRLHESAGHGLRDALADWITPHLESLQAAWPDIPNEIQDRDADCWEPLLAIADLAGGDWPERARVAAVAFVADKKDNARESLGVRLLADVRQAFRGQNDEGKPIFLRESLSTEHLLRILNALDESPWGDLRGKPLDARALSRRLNPYGIKPKTIRVGDSTPKGYERADFADAWQRYLPGDAADAQHPQQAQPEAPALTAAAATSATTEADPAGLWDSSAIQCARCSSPLGEMRVAYGKTLCVPCESTNTSTERHTP